MLRIVRNLAQYFYPQRQTKVMNEGCATFVHYTIMNPLYDRGLITEGSLLEFLHSHTSVVFQPDFDDPRYGGINPYALGFAMMEDIKRICDEPTAEDRDWFPDFAGYGDWSGALKDAWANYRDESFIGSSCQPEPDARFPAVRADDKADEPSVQGRRDPRRRGLSPRAHGAGRQYDVARDRARHPGRRRRPDRRPSAGPAPCGAQRRRPRRSRAARATMRHIRRLWGYQVRLEEMPTNG